MSPLGITWLTLDDDVAAENRRANEQMEAAMLAGPRMWEVEPARVRRARQSGRGSFGLPPADPRSVDIDVPGQAVTLHVLAPAEPHGVLVHIHGGGFTYGAPNEYESWLATIADHTGLTAVSIDYRLAPEHPYPAGPDDCEAAVRWLLDDASEARRLVPGLGNGPMLIAGDSAGANLCVTTLVRLRDRHGIVGAFAGAVLNYGWFDLGLSPSMRQWGDRQLVLSTPLVEFLATGYAGPDREARRAPDISPLHASLHDLPPALFSVGTADPLHDDSVLMAHRWHAAGSEATLVIYPEGMHGFDFVATTLAAISIDRSVDWIRRILERG